MKTSRRQQSGDDKRGNSRDRKARKIWMLNHFGNGESAPCSHCEAQLRLAEIEADRINPGGSYRRDNVQPACGPCNRTRSNKIEWVPPRLRSLRRSDLALA